jgi:hypothetical protein
VRFAHVDVLFGCNQSAEHGVDMVLVITQWAQRAQWHWLIFNDDAGLQRALEQV